MVFFCLVARARTCTDVEVRLSRGQGSRVLRKVLDKIKAFRARTCTDVEVRRKHSLMKTMSSARPAPMRRTADEFRSAIYIK